MEKLQKLIDCCWKLVDKEQVNGDMLPSLDECQSELYAIQQTIREYAITSFNCDHELKAVFDKRYPFKPIRCIKCGYEP